MKFLGRIWEASWYTSSENHVFSLISSTVKQWLDLFYTRHEARNPNKVLDNQGFTIKRGVNGVLDF